MSVIVNDDGFGQDVVSQNNVLDIGPDANPDDLTELVETNEFVRIEFPSFSDGRGLTIARRLRLMGCTGHIRARGHILADQYEMVRRAGFDDVEISNDLAARQPEHHWLARANWRANDYQARLRG